MEDGWWKMWMANNRENGMMRDEIMRWCERADGKRQMWEVNFKLRIKDENDEIQDLPTGREIIKDNDDEIFDNKPDENEDDKENKTQISFTKDVLPFVIPQK